MYYCRSYSQQRFYKETVKRVIKLQCAVRRWLAQKRLQKMQNQQSAAKCIQAHYRSVKQLE